MAAPTSYTEERLADYMHTVLGAVASAMGYSSPASYTEAVNEALLDYGVDDISSISGRENIRKLRVIARVRAWKQVIAEVSGDFDFSADGGQYSRSQVQEMALKALEQAESDAMALGAIPGYVVGVDAVTHIHDPYRYVDDEERVIP